MSEMDVISVVVLSIAAIAGILSAIFPEYAWYLEKGMWYKDSEPTDGAILMTRIGGIVLAVIAAVFILIIVT